MTEKSLKGSFTKEDSLCLKGVAILFMVLHHCFCSVDRFEAYTVNFAPFSQDFAVDFCNYLKICVSMFAFITGYGLYLSAKKSCQSLKNAGLDGVKASQNDDAFLACIYSRICYNADYIGFAFRGL